MTDLEAAADGVVALESRAEHAEQQYEAAQQQLACSTPRPTHDDPLLCPALPSEACQALQHAARSCRHLSGIVVAHLLLGQHPLGVPLPATDAQGTAGGGDREALGVAIAVRDWQRVAAMCRGNDAAAAWAARACEVTHRSLVAASLCVPQRVVDGTWM